MISGKDEALQTEPAPCLISSQQLFLTLPSFSVQEESHHDLSYPVKPYRYSPYGVNHYAQACYTEADIQLMKKIQFAFGSLLDKPRADHYFSIDIKTRFRDWWTCTKPNYTVVDSHWTAESFTLPSREAKDIKTFPLSNFADNTARRIANWQGERVKNQKLELSNDPVMLVFEELRDWFFNILSEKECKREDLDVIAKRQSYIKDIMYLTPNFGPDRLNFHDIQHSLEDAAKIILSCIANKELPQLLSEIIITGKNLETAVGTYLHYLLIDQEVTENFAANFLEGKGRNCHLSPVCTIHKNLDEVSDYSTSDQRLVRYLGANKFFRFNKVSEENGVMKVQLQLKQSILSNIKFASFISNKDKEQYLYALASLEALINVRKTLESFQNVQPRIGTYVFAAHYLEKTNALASNYIDLIGNTKSSIQGLIKLADNSLDLHLMGADDRDPAKQTNRFFERNLRALETKVAKGTTVSAQLETYSSNAVRSMHDYQIEMRKLAANYNSGKASIEIEQAMQELYMKMDSLNAVLPRLLDNQNIVIPTQLSITDGMILPSHNGPSVSGGEIRQYDDMMNYPFDSGQWDHVIKTDKETNKPIFTYRVYKNNTEVGSAEFYGQPLLCVSPNKQRHNIIKVTGVLSSFKLTDDMTVEEICRALPPTLFDKVLLSASNAAKHGAIRGVSNVIGVTLQSYGATPKVAKYISQFAYVSALFGMKFASYYEQMQERDETVRAMNAIYYAAIETGQVVVTSLALNFVSDLIKRVGAKLEKNNWPSLGGGLTKAASYLSFGVFAYHAAEQGVVPTSVALVSGTVTEKAIEKTAQFLSKH